MVTAVVRWLPHSFDFHFPLSAVGRQRCCHLLLSLTAVTVRAHTHSHANTFACDESRASGAISRNAGAINSLQISLYRHDDGPVLISLYYPRRLSCVYALSHARFILAFRPVIEQVWEQLSWALPSCHLHAAIIPFTGWRTCVSPHLQEWDGGWNGGIKVYRSQLSGAQSDNSLRRSLSPPSYYPQCISLR